MPTVNVYLSFQGNCEVAFTFYKSIFGGEFSFLGRYKDLSVPVREDYFPFCSDDQIMHMGLPISKETMLMGCDRMDSIGEPQVNRFALIVSVESKMEADRIFNCLASEGEIIVPIENQFWGSYYGQCIDKFGINWKISFNNTEL